jgi:hypothetical protein
MQICLHTRLITHAHTHTHTHTHSHTHTHTAKLQHSRAAPHAGKRVDLHRRDALVVQAQNRIRVAATATVAGAGALERGAVVVPPEQAATMCHAPW